MPNTYRIVETQPNNFLTQMATAAGWTTINSATTMSVAMQAIVDDKTKRAFVQKIYDENGNQVADVAVTTS